MKSAEVLRPTITNEELRFLVMPTLLALSKRSLPPRGAMRIRRMVREYDPLRKDLEAVRLQTLEKYGTKDAEGELLKDDQGNVEFADGQRAAFEMVWADALADEIECHATITLEHFGDDPIEAQLLIGLCNLLIEEIDQ